MSQSTKRNAEQSRSAPSKAEEREREKDRMSPPRGSSNEDRRGMKLMFPLYPLLVPDDRTLQFSLQPCPADSKLKERSEHQQPWQLPGSIRQGWYQHDGRDACFACEEALPSSVWLYVSIFPSSYYVAVHTTASHAKHTNIVDRACSF